MCRESNIEKYSVYGRGHTAVTDGSCGESKGVQAWFLNKYAVTLNVVCYVTVYSSKKLCVHNFAFYARSVRHSSMAVP